jgi:predicted site-specific integrase-resolvase
MCVRHLNQHQLARRWCMSPRTLERWRWTGEGPRYLKLGGRIVYREDDIEAYEAVRLQARTTEPAASDSKLEAIQ